MNNPSTTIELEIIYNMNVNSLIREGRKEDQRILYEEWFQDYEKNLQKGLDIIKARKEATRNLRERIGGASILPC